MFMPAALLLVSIAVEVTATSLLPRSRGFTDPFWSAVVVGGYAVALWLLAIVVRTLPVSVAYAVWAGLAPAAVAIIGWLYLDEPMSWLKAGSLAFIALGVAGLAVVGKAH